MPIDKPPDPPKPTPEDLARSASEDLAICEAASAPWTAPAASRPSNITGMDGRALSLPEALGLDSAGARYFLLALEALPAWIRRAAAAEARVRELEAELKRIRHWDPTSPLPCPLCRYERGLRLQSCVYHQWIGDLVEETDRLRARLEGKPGEG